MRQLGTPKVAHEFDLTLAAAVALSPVLCNLNKTVAFQTVPLDACNNELIRIVKNVAEEILIPVERKRKNQKQLQERQDLFKLIHANNRVRRIDSMRRYNELSDFPAQRRQLVLRLVQATRAYERAKKESERVEAEAVLRKMSRTSHINVRLDICFKFLKARKRASVAKCPGVTHQSLENELDKLDHGPISTITLSDHIPMDPPPSVREFGVALLSAKTGVSPGLDLISSEFYHASPTLHKLTAKLMHASYIQSEPPTAWSQTTITLIPKIPRPLLFSDLRPITLSAAAYKAFARVLLEILQQYVGEIKSYQSGFMNNRSCDDQHFAQQRILETEWNHGRAVYMLSLDFKQAFSSVNLHKLAEILLDRNVPCYFINIIIRTCLTEMTSYNWMGSPTSSKVKTVGVKQGCTIAPYLFVIVLDFILARAQKELHESHQLELYLGEKNHPITLPTLFAYADDINILTHTPQELDVIMSVAVPIMQEYGLELNTRKCHLVRKAQVSLFHTTASKTVTLGGLDIPIGDSMMVLGSVYSENMNRRQMILSRCTKAIRLFYVMRKHLINCQLSFDILVRLYKVVIAPVLLFGLRSVSITKGNQLILVRRELLILKSLAQLSNPPANNAEILRVLKGRTINRRLTVSRLVFHGHVQRAAATGLLHKARDYHLNQKRRVGRPLFTYDKTIQGELGHLLAVINHEEWSAALHNREKLKKLCERIYDQRDYSGDPMPATARLSDNLFGHAAR